MRTSYMQTPKPLAADRPSMIRSPPIISSIPLHVQCTQALWLFLCGTGTTMQMPVPLQAPRQPFCFWNRRAAVSWHKRNRSLTRIHERKHCSSHYSIISRKGIISKEGRSMHILSQRRQQGGRKGARRTKGAIVFKGSTDTFSNFISCFLCVCSWQIRLCYIVTPTNARFDLFQRPAKYTLINCSNNPDVQK